MLIIEYREKQSPHITKADLFKDSERKNLRASGKEAPHRDSQHPSTTVWAQWPVDTSGLKYYFERQEANYCGRHAFNNLVQRRDFKNGEFDTAKQRRPGSASGDWLADGLVAALRLRSYTVDDLIATDQIYELSRSNDTQMILICNGAHHVTVRRFVTGRPLIFFDSTVYKIGRLLYEMISGKSCVEITKRRIKSRSTSCIQVSHMYRALQVSMPERCVSSKS